MNKIRIIRANVLNGLELLGSGVADSCVTDPPYELGFMGKKWDSSGIAYSVEVWKEVYRVLKPGAHLLAFGGSRTSHRLACAIEDAGFEIRDQIQWIYGSGFPKSLDISKGIGIITAPATSLARQWDGWGTALKPAHEPIVVARKSLEGTVVQNVLKHGCGGLNIAGCRVEYEDTQDPSSNPLYRKQAGYKNTAGADNGSSSYTLKREECERNPNDLGRWPANVIHDGSEEVVAEFEKAGERPSGAMKKPYTYKNNGFSMGAPSGETRANHDSNTGSAARFFYCAKASQEERNRGCESLPAKKSDVSEKEGNPGGDNPRNRGVRPVKNNHPTVKPLALMAYLVRLVTPPGGMVLDCFCGSGSTLIAAAKEGFDSVGIDKEAAYVEIAEKRLIGNLGMLIEISKTLVS